MPEQPVYTHNDYMVGWVCALDKEQTAAIAMLDGDEHPPLPQPRTDVNAYTLGSVRGHNVVIACLPLGKTGNSSSAAVAARMVSTFPAIKICLMVGIAGGVGSNVRLGDVVVSTPFGQHPGVVQWDFGKSVKGGGFERTGALNNPPTSVLTNLTKLKSKHTTKGTSIPGYLDGMVSKFPKLKKKFTKSATFEDVLFAPEYVHIDGGDSCKLCDRKMKVEREPRDEEDEITVHYGLIASGNQVIKDAVKRDEINKFLGGHVLCLEMEAAGLMNDFPCVVIRGICDYADSHKNKVWQEYAAAVAAAYAKEFLDMLPVADLEREKTIVAALEDVGKEVKTAVALMRDVSSIQRTHEDESILRWLTALDYATEQSNNLERREQGTGQWLLDSVVFQKWLSDHGQTLFLPGEPGVGKTILSSVIIDHLDQAFPRSCNVGIAYLYLNHNQAKDQEYLALLTSLLKQLAQSLPALPEKVKELYQKHYPRSLPKSNEIRGALVAVASQCSRVFIVIDALSEGRLAWKKLQCEVFNLQEKYGANILATSRPNQEIASGFEVRVGGAVLEIETPQADVERFLGGNMDKLPNCVRSLTDIERAQLQAEIIKRILQVTNGVFLIAYLLFTALVHSKHTIEALHNDLKMLPDSPKGYDIFYKDVMTRIKSAPSGSSLLAMQALTWIVYARRPLSAAELQHALAITPNDPAITISRNNLVPIADIVDACDGLVTLSKTSSPSPDPGAAVVGLTSLTAHEYLARTKGEWFPAAEWHLTTACVTHLLFDVFKNGMCRTDSAFEAQMRAHPFYRYAAAHWGDHAAEVTSSLPSVVREFLQDAPKMEAAVQVLATDGLSSACTWEGYSQRVPKGAGILHLAAAFGAENLLSEGLTASRAGGGAVAVDVEAKDSHGRTPLGWAAVHDRKNTALMLLDTAKADPNLRDDRGLTPLALAAVYGSDSVARLLLTREGVEVELADHEGFTPFVLAVQNEHEQVIKTFLEVLRPTGKEVHHELWWAIDQGNESVFRLLLDATQSDAQYWEETAGRTLFWAVERGQAAIVELLLAAKGVDVNCRNDRGETPLIKMACGTVRNREEVLDLLLKSPAADPSLKDNQGRTALSVAAEYGDTRIVARLLHVGEVDVNCQDGYGRTPVFLAAREGHEEIVRMLLQCGKSADPNLKDWNDATPLSEAEKERHWGIYNLLVAAGATLIILGEGSGVVDHDAYLKVRKQREELEKRAKFGVSDHDIDSGDDSQTGAGDLDQDGDLSSENDMEEVLGLEVTAKSDTSEAGDSGLDLSHLEIFDHDEHDGPTRQASLPMTQHLDVQTGCDAENSPTASEEGTAMQACSTQCRATTFDNSITAEHTKMGWRFRELNVPNTTTQAIPHWRQSVAKCDTESTVDSDEENTLASQAADDTESYASSDQDSDVQSDDGSQNGSEIDSSDDADKSEAFQEMYNRVMRKQQ